MLAVAGIAAAGLAQGPADGKTLAMREDRVSQLGIETMEDLARQAPRLTIGGDVEFFDRPEWIAVRKA